MGAGLSFDLDDNQLHSVAQSPTRLPQTDAGVPQHAPAPAPATPHHPAPLPAHLTTALTLFTVDALQLLATTLLVEPRLGPALPAALAPLLLAHALLDLYPGYGLMEHERLRRRWIAGSAYSAGLVLALTGFNTHAALACGVSALIFMMLAPLVQAITIWSLHKLGFWGMGAYCMHAPRPQAATYQTLARHWQLGLIPAPRPLPGTPVILPPGVAAGLWPDAQEALYRLDDAGLLTRLRTNSPRLRLPIPDAGRHNPQMAPWRQLKRSMDVLIAAPALLMSLPIMMICGLIVYRRDPGPVFYRQQRRGLHGKPITIWKMRSMYRNNQAQLDALLSRDPVAASQWYASYKLPNDPRILPGIGHVMRKYSIDELPQLWNVLRGDLSLVGPRVFVEYDLKAYSPAELKLRDQVLPGLTGWWQVHMRGTGTNQDKVSYDLAYMTQWNIWLDLCIMLRTIGTILTGRGGL